MGKRFTCSEKWEDRWFTNLSPDAKLIMDYMTCTCDCAGVWEPNYEAAEFKVGITRQSRKLDWDELFEEFNRIPVEVGKIEQLAFDQKPKKLVPHVLITGSKKWWLPRFIPFQYGGKGDFFLNEHAPLHVPIFRALRAHKLWDKFCEYYPDSITLANRKNPPTGLAVRGDRTLPVLQEVLKWPEAAGMDEAEVRLFYFHWQAKGWRVDGRVSDDFHALLGRWRAKKELDQKNADLKGESPAALRKRIDACEEFIGKLREDTHLPVGKHHSEVKPEAMAKIKEQKKLIERYETELRERKKSDSGGGKDAAS